MHNLYILSPNRDSGTVNLSTMCITAVLDTLSGCHGGIMTPGDFGDASPRGFGSGGRTVRAQRSCDLTVERGEIVALLGPNGAGKSTLIDLVLGFTMATTGTVEVFGTTPRAAIDAQRVGAVMQTGGLLPDLTVAMTLRTIAAFPTPRDIDEVLDLADLTALPGRRVGKCSGGEQQRIRFALALLGSPDLLILDEPTAGMDAASRHRFWDTMAARAAEGVTVVFATHYLEEAQNFARRIVMLDRGGTIADGTLRGTRGQRPRPHLDRGGRHTHRHRRGRRGVRRDGP